MALTPEDKKKIYEEEKTRLKAQQKAKQDLEVKNTCLGVLGCLGTILVIALIIWISGIFINENDNSSKEKAEVKITDVNPAPEIKTIGISYDQVIEHIANFFVYEERTTLEGQDGYVIKSLDESAILEVIGQKKNISRANLAVGIPSDDTETLIRNTAILLRFVKNLFPGWKESSDWVTEAIKKVSNNPGTSEKTVRGNKEIELHLLGIQGLRQMILIKVKPI